MTQICVSVFDNSTEEQFWEHPLFMGNSKKVHVVGQGDIVLVYNKVTKCVTGIAILRVIENGKIYRVAHPYDKALYSEEYMKYNKYEIGVKSFRIEPVPLEAINFACGVLTNAPIVNGHLVSFKRNQKLASWAKNALLQAMIAEHK